MFKEEKGMTLVSLVIAIVVLLALAGTVVFLVFGKNGIAAGNPIVVQTQDRNYAEDMVKVGLKGVRNEAKTSNIETTISGEVSSTSQMTNDEKMDLLIDLLGGNDFSKESETVLNYKGSGNTFKITVNFENYTITKIE